MKATWALLIAASFCHAGEAELKQAFIGREMVVRIDMPGSHHGVDLHLDHDEPLDRDLHAQRLREFGIAIPKGRKAKVTSIVVKREVIELHLDGGGYGTFGDDTKTKVSTDLPKTSYERRLESDLRRAKDSSARRRIESDLRRERNRRYAKERALREKAPEADEAQREKVMTRRLAGGSRFNLRQTPGTTAATPEAVKQWLATYVDFQRD